MTVNRSDPGLGRDAQTADPGACPFFVKAMDILGRRWSALIIEAIGRGNAGFAEISKFVGAVGDPMLARRLRELESDGMLTREVVDGRPIRVRYSLTVCGSELLPILRQINVWAHANNLVDLPDPQHPLGVL